LEEHSKQNTDLDTDTTEIYTLHSITTLSHGLSSAIDTSCKRQGDSFFLLI